MVANDVKHIEINKQLTTLKFKFKLLARMF